MVSDVYDLLLFEEGFRAKPYVCTEGYVTIGIGTKLCNKKNESPLNFPIEFTEEIATLFLQNDVVVVSKQLQNHPTTKIAWGNANEERRDIFVSMAYQMGMTGLLKFKKMWKYASSGSWQMAATEAWDSRWAKQTPERAKRHVQVLLSGTFDVYNR